MSASRKTAPGAFRTLLGFAASLVVIVSVLTCLASAGEDVSPSTVAALKRSVVPVLCAATNRTPLGTIGTAFFVNRQGDFITPAHVVLEAREFSAQHGNCLLAVYVPVGGWHQAQGFTAHIFPFTRCELDQALDIALCRPTANPFADRADASFIRPVSFEVAVQPDGTALAFTGFPLNNRTPISAKGFVAAYYYHGTRPAQVLIDKTAWPGASGSPLYLANGRVVGMITMTGAGFGSGLSYARAAAQIVAFLRAHPR